MQKISLSWLRNTLLFLLSISSLLNAQSTKIDSLEHSLSLATTLRDSAILIEQLARQVQYTDPGAAIERINLFREIHRKHGDVGGLIRAEIQANLPYVYLNKMDSVKAVALRGLGHFNLLPIDSLRKFRGGLYKNLATYYHMNGVLDSAAIHYANALEFLPPNEQAYAGLLLNRSGLFISERNYEAAIQDLETAIDFARQTDNDRMLAPALGGAATAYHKLERYEEMARLTQESIKLFQKQNDTNRLLNTEAEHCVALRGLGRDTALMFCRKVYKNASLQNNGYALLLSADQLSRIFELNGLSDSVRYYVSKAYSERKSHQDRSFEAYYTRRYADQLLADNTPGQALKLAQEAVDFYLQDSIHYLVELEDAYFTLATAFAKTGNTNAGVNYFEKARQLSKTNAEAKLSTGVAKAEVGFRTRETQLALDLEKQARQADTAAANNQRKLLFGGIAAALLLLTVVTLAYAKIRKDKARIEAQNAEREVLLREIHHRVKNNLQIISGLLAKQARTTANEEVKALMKDGQDRVHSMALIHQSIYNKEELADVSVRDYVFELTSHLKHSHANSDQHIDIQFSVADTRLEMDKAIPLGLILNELITNAFKYGFSNKKTGKLLVSFSQSEDDKYTLTVEDDGHGLPPDYESKIGNHLGLNLVRGLTRQLKGEWKIGGAKAEGGTNVQIQFS